MARLGRVQRDALFAVSLVVAGSALAAIAAALISSSWSRAAVVAALTALASTVISPWANSAVKLWLKQRERVAERDQIGSDAEVKSPQAAGSGLPLIRDSMPETSGLNAAARFSELHDLPPYVQRDMDDAFRSAIRRVKDESTGGLFVLVGAPLSGKTRTQYEAVRAILPDWTWYVPNSLVDLQREIESQRSLRKKVIWLDELDKYLEGEHPLEPGSVRRLISRGVGAIIMGNLWPAQFEKFKQRPLPKPSEDLTEDALSGQRYILRMAHVFNLPPRLSSDERARAEVLGRMDIRIRQALASTQYTFTQVLGSAPDLIQHWQQADTYAKAVLDASIDLRRSGYALPIPKDLLQQAAETLLDASAKAAAPLDWFDQAMEYSTRLLQGRVKALIPVSATAGNTDGYTVADFIQEEAIKERGHLPIPLGIWEVLRASDLTPFELLNLGRNARIRLNLDYAEEFLLKSFRVSPGTSWLYLIDLYDQQDRLTDMEPILREAVSRGLPGSRGRLAVLYQRLGQTEELVQVLTEAQRSGEVESLWLLRWLVLRSQLQPEAEEIYRTAANSGSRGAWQFLVYILMSDGRAQEAREIIAEADSIGDADAWWGLATLTDTPEQFEELLRVAVSKRRPGAWMELANLLVVTGRSAEAISFLTEAVNEGQSGAAEELIETLEELGREDEAKALKTRGMKAWMAERADSL